jgi:hypothetical protein
MDYWERGMGRINRWYDHIFPHISPVSHSSNPLLLPNIVPVGCTTSAAVLADGQLYVTGKLAEKSYGGFDDIATVSFSFAKHEWCLDLPNVSASSAPIADYTDKNVLMYAGHVVDGGGRWHRMCGIRSFLPDATDHIIYDPHAPILDWQLRPRTPTPLTDCSAAIHGSTIYITGIPSTGLPSHMMTYDLQAAKWSISPMPIPEDGREGRMILVQTPFGLLALSDGTKGRRAALTRNIWLWNHETSAWELSTITCPEPFTDISAAYMVDQYLMIIGSSIGTATRPHRSRTNETTTCWMLNMNMAMQPGRTFSPDDDWIEWSLPTDIATRKRIAVAVY